MKFKPISGIVRYTSRKCQLCSVNPVSFATVCLQRGIARIPTQLAIKFHFGLCALVKSHEITRVCTENATDIKNAARVRVGQSFKRSRQLLIRLFPTQTQHAQILAGRAKVLPFNRDERGLTCWPSFPPQIELIANAAYLLDSSFALLGAFV